MKKTITLLFFFFAFTQAKAQYVSIPDTNFVKFLVSKYPTAMSGNMLDTTNSLIVNAGVLDCKSRSISNLYGIQFFDKLKTLECSNNKLTSLSIFPPSLTKLICYNNGMTSLSSLPSGLDTLICTRNSLTSLPSLPGSLGVLVCNQNSLTSLPALPSGLDSLYCDSNSLTSLPALPGTLRGLNCAYNNLTSLPSLPVSLKNLDCEFNSITILPTLPASLKSLTCNFNNLTGIPTPNDSLWYLSVSHNNIVSLPTLNHSLFYLDCGNNSLTSLPTLPDSLRYINCTSNDLTSLPSLPYTLQQLYCSYNDLTSLPTLPAALHTLFCSFNNLTGIPNMPSKLNNLQCRDNPSLYCLPSFSRDVFATFTVRKNTGITCLPKPIKTSYSEDSSQYLPICKPSSGCPISHNIVGNVHEDTSVTCALDSIHNGITLQNIKLKKYKNGILDHQYFSFENGYYGFDADITDSIDVVVDTVGLPFTVSCPSIGHRSARLTLSDSVFYNQDFGIECKGTDLGVASIYGTFRRGVTRPLYIKGGDISLAYKLNCSKGTGGTVTTTISGSASYASPYTGALTPSSVSGSNITYTIADFGAINLYTAFNIWVKTDSSAVVGSSICIKTIVTTSSTDINSANDTLTYCGNVVNSHDPNDKLVYPAHIVAADEWLTYTINFQNTGTDTAYHIIVRDTLDSYLDIGSFTYLASSHQPQIDIAGSAVMFNFPRINLLDSFHNEPESHGWLQYKIKSLATLPPFASIKNKASIYFDDNEPIVTNTTSNLYTPLSIRNNNRLVDFRLYPNPAFDAITILASEKGEFKLFNLMGSEVYRTSVSKSNTTINISLPQLANGLYIYEFRADNAVTNNGKLVIQSK